jgi:hypothetical protein
MASTNLSPTAANLITFQMLFLFVSQQVGPACDLSKGITKSIVPLRLLFR